MKETSPDVRRRASRSEVIALTARIRTNLDETARTFWDIGCDLGRVKRERLYEVLQYATFRDYVAGELHVKVRQVQKMLAIAQTYVRDDAVAVGGIERGTALIGYCKLLPGRPDPGELLRGDAPVGDKPLSTCSVQDIVGAAQVLRDARALARSRSGAARRESRASKDLEKALRAFVRESSLGRVHIDVRSDEVVVRFARGALVQRLRDR